MKEKDEEKKINIFESELVPKHEIMPGEEKAELLERLNITLRQLPKVKEGDPVVKILGAKKGDVLRITKKSIGGECYYFRVVV